jgi:chromosome segregation ATPase
MEFIVDLVLAGLLCSALIWGVLLTRRLAAFAKSRDELAALVASLSGAVDKAEHAIAELRRTSSSAEATLATRLTEVRQLADEVTMMRDAGEALARRLEQAAVAPRQALAPATQISGAATGPTNRANRDDMPAMAARTGGRNAERLSTLAAQIAALNLARRDVSSPARLTGRR